MDDLQSEKEQIEEMKAWWAEYGRYVIAGVVIAVGLLLGFNYHKSSKLEAELQASDLFESLAGYVVDGDLDAATPVAEELYSNYANTAYAAQSRLVMARLFMDQNRDQDAADALRELLGMSGNGALKHVARARLARILLYQDKPQEVLDLLAEQTNPGFAGLYAEARGDAHAALGDYEAAATAYEEALADTSQAVNRGVVQMKLLDLPDELPMPTAEPAPEPAAEEAGAEEASPEAAEPAVEEGAEPVAEPEAGAAE
ncbi:MAG: tetratricopeptide repeat protein [Woeseiaceae bacterium]|nr:tetratricopeptide repeat protein [Woeseiaceae bacterium]